jgi:hypothetical protein
MGPRGRLIDQVELFYWFSLERDVPATHAAFDQAAQ